MISLLCLFLARSDPPQDAETPAGSGDAGPVVEGELTAGLRLREIDGSGAQFDEDLNLEEGLFVRGFRLEARDLEGLPLRSLELLAEGIGEPFSTYRLEALGGPWRTIGRFDRSQYVGNAQADQHPFEVERESGALTFQYEPRDSPSRSSFGLDYLHRDSLALGTRSVGFEFVSGFPVRKEEKSYGARGNFATEAAGWRLELDLGLRNLEAGERLEFAEPSRNFPGALWTEEFEADSDGRQQRGELRLERELGRGAQLDLGFDWSSTDLVGDFSSFETGFLFDPSLPFERTTSGDLELEERELEGEAGLRFPLAESAALDLRYIRHHEELDGDLLRTILLDELMGEPPSVGEFPDSSKEEGTIDLFQLGADLRPHERVGLDLQLEWARDALDIEQVVDDVTVRRFDDSVNEFGGRGALSLELGRGTVLDLSAGHAQQPTETALVGVEFTFEDSRTTFADLACRSRGRLGSVSGEIRQEHRTSDAFRSQGDFGRYAFSLASELGASLTLAYLTYDLEADTTFLFFDPVSGFQEVPAVVSFDGHQVALGGSWQRSPGASLRPGLSWSATLSSGDSDFAYVTAGAALPWSLGRGVEVGVDASYHEFNGDGLLDPSDYQALVLELFVRKAFGPRSP